VKKYEIGSSFFTGLFEDSLFVVGMSRANIPASLDSVVKPLDIIKVKKIMTVKKQSASKGKE
jgi:hypothetical protein